MKKYAAFLKLTRSFQAIRIAVIFSAAMVPGLTFLATQPVSAQIPESITVQVGQRRFNRVKHPVDATNVQIAVQEPAMVRATYDQTTGRFYFAGISEGKTRVTITGTYPSPNAGGGITGQIRPNAVSYKHLVDVTVVPRAPNPVANAYRAEVMRGKVKDIAIAAVLGPEFLRPSDEGKRWRSIVLTYGDNGIALAEVAGKSRIRVSGVSFGNTTLRLEAERFKNNVWEKTARPIVVTVIDDPNAAPPDPWLEGLERALNGHKNAALRVGTDESKIARSIRGFESFGTVVANAITKERSLPKPQRSRLERLENMRDETRDQLGRLRGQHAEIAKQIVTITWNSRLSDLDIYLGPRPAKRIFFCPPNPQKTFGGEVYGTGSYLIISPICAAAVHDKALTFAGGNITVEFRQGRDGDKYIGSRQNDIVSDSWARSWGSFVFIKR